ncbi:hypothetical protein [Clostridium sp.]|uniref:hypothetical protein n=1 Tax=Clostridium sp. TaxID=1506 RepID=UPI0028406E2A|nr:hypothetical protein [Clostridium sp.]MDR3596530.1 hypothetical protein [Clostridium sp.]
MNIQKIFDALEEDEMNSALGIICVELENQGYAITIENIKVTAEEIFNNKYPSLEEVPDSLNIKLSKGNFEEQKFAIDFVDYHKVIIKKFKN